MAYQDKVVDVQVTLGTNAITTTGFETAMFLAVHNLFPERVRFYISTESMVEDGFAVGSPAHEFATNAFSGKFAPQMVAIGRMSSSGTRIDFTGTSNTETVVVNITINGVIKAVQVPVIQGETSATIAANLVDAITVDADLTDISATATGSIVTLTSTDPFSVGKGAGEYKIQSTSAETVATVLPQILTENRDWYFLSHELRTDADIVAAAEFAQAYFKFHVYNSTDSDALAAANSTSSIFDILKGLSYTSLGTYDKYADQNYTEGCVIGAMASNDPSFGDSLHLKEMPGMQDSGISETQRINSWGRNANIYRTMYGGGTYIEGKVSNGQYADVIRFSHWVKFRMEESLFASLKNRSNQDLSMKMSDDDLPVIRSVLCNNPLNVGIRNGGILTGYDEVNNVTYDPIVTIPRRAEIPTADLQSRILRDVKVDLVYNNSLHYVKIRVSVNLDRPVSTTSSAQTSATSSIVGV